MDTLDLDVTALVAGGDGISRHPDGRVVFVRGAAADERVRVLITEQRKDFLRGEVVDVVRPGPGRVAPPCRFVAAGCGGCGWQHLDHRAQRRAKADLVVEAIRRASGVDIEVGAGPDLPAGAGRTTLRAIVSDGRLGFRRRGSHEAVRVETCMVAHPLVDEIIGAADVQRAHEVVIKVGARTGERLVVLEPDGTVAGLPPDVKVTTGAFIDQGDDACIHEVVGGRRFRISARSFFQSRPDGAEALVAEVERAAGQARFDDERLVDLYGGVGLFARALGEERPVTVVESSKPAARDAAHNLAELDAEIARVAVERWRPRPGGLVVADPPRAGLGRPGVAAVVATGTPTLVLVSCDAPSLGRDVALLQVDGYRLTEATLVDLFPFTAQVEVVSRFELSSGTSGVS